MVGGEGRRSRVGGADRARPAGRRDQRRPGGGPGPAAGPVPDRGGRPPAGRPGAGKPGGGGVPPQVGRPLAGSASAQGRRVGPHDWFAQRILAVVSGQRPVHSLLGLTVGEAYDQLVALAPSGPLRDRLRPVLRHCGRFHPGPGVIEAFARIAAGERVSAMAFRLEQGADLRWRCAAVEIRGPRLWGSPPGAVVS
ncbi:Rv3235 family protein [Streptomyces sp. NPDC059708]|uniref:Rv3235 family protein n=1 Tax=Streptomyces sp. NPDC059708 TaxID=3346916 RepID=UPI00369E2D15